MSETKLTPAAQVEAWLLELGAVHIWTLTGQAYTGIANFKAWALNGRLLVTEQFRGGSVEVLVPLSESDNLLYLRGLLCARAGRKLPEVESAEQSTADEEADRKYAEAMGFDNRAVHRY